jgi:hypothetical protein
VVDSGSGGAVDGGDAMSSLAILNSDAERQRWIETVQAFCDELAGWSENQGWTVTRSVKELREEGLGAYAVPMLTIQAPRGTVKVDPVGREVLGAVGRIDLYAYPTLFRVMLLRSGKDGRWRILTDSGIYLKQPWNETTFAELVTDLTVAGDEPSTD